MARHTVNLPPLPPPSSNLEVGDLYASTTHGGEVYILTKISAREDSYMLVSLNSGARWNDPDADPFGGESAQFHRIPGDRTITVE